MAEVLHVKGEVLVSEQESMPELWVIDGKVSFTPPTSGDVETVTGYVLPGFVDAHCHVGLGKQGAVDAQTSEAQALAELEARLRAAVRSWPESLGRAIGLEFEDDKAGALGPVWENAFPGSYREDYEIEEAIQDLKRCEELWGRDPDLPAEVRVAQTEDGQVRLNIYLTQSLSLTELLPLLQAGGSEDLPTHQLGRHLKAAAEAAMPGFTVQLTSLRMRASMRAGLTSASMALSSSAGTAG